MKPFTLLLLCSCLLMFAASWGADVEEPRDKWMSMEKNVKSMIQKIMRKATPTLMKEVYKKDISTSCLTALLQFSSALKQVKAWPMSMLDSSGRLPIGVMSGTLTDLGNYQQCVRIRVNETKVKLQGQYCMIQVMPPIPEWKPFTSMHGTVPALQNLSAPDSMITHLVKMVHNLHATSLKIGICTPSMCSEDDIDRLIKILPEKFELDWKVDVLHCEIQEPLKFTQPQVSILYLLGTVAFLVLVGSFVDVLCSTENMEKRSLKSTLFHIVRSFSFPANARKLADYTGGSDERLHFVNGILFVVLFWVAMSNTFMYVNYDTTSNLIRAFEFVQEFFYEVVLNRVMPLQAVFFVSGLVTTYKWLKTPEEKFNVIKFLLKRYLRYTPAYALVLALIVLTPTWGSGPSWDAHMSPVYANCKDNWWYNVLYINNFIDPESMCLDHAWVFAVDAQLHILAIFILIPLKMRPKVGLMVMFVLSVASLLSVALTNVYFDLPPNETLAFLHQKDRWFYAHHTYHRMYTHIAMYCTGCFIAYLTHHQPNMKFTKKVHWTSWLGSLVILCGALLTVHCWRDGTMPNATVAAAYAVLGKVAEAVFLGWIALACLTDNAGFLKEVLAWRPFAFLGRLMFLAYLMHVPVITMVMNFRKSHMFVSDLEIIYVVLNHLSAAYIVAYALHMFFEAPFISLGDVVRRCHKMRTIGPSQLEKPLEKAAVTTKAWVKSNC
ncbi:hypothetical protein JTE90_000274 [Oedothorax gibbosus]|uniref:Nose resistant-to-fluoxetine protein N-terminal domain-containing protein n=1 Tax=Oedothorax gibbosus TaxID=931172 RepID=A0AAV6VVA8_9ARAC|nr:hypothetical protein JTE90_000274 [Oedothorax gibbosus]